MNDPQTNDLGLVDVLVVGAGVSGLVAARRALERGAESVRVLEADSRVGGRTQTHRLDDSTVLDLGGQWVGPTQDRVLALADELGIQRFPTFNKGRAVIMLGGRRRTHRTSVPYPFPFVAFDFLRTAARLELMARSVDPAEPWNAKRAAQWDAMTAGEFLDRRMRTAGGRVLFDVVSGLTFGGEPDELSLLGVLAHIRAAGGLNQLIAVRGGAQEQRFVGGSQRISLEIAEQLGNAVQLNSPVTSVEWSRNRVVVGANSETVHARRVVVALSPADRSRIQFTPALPDGLERGNERSEAFSGFKIQLVYDRPFWRDQGLSGQAVSDMSPAPVTFDNSPPDGSLGILVAFVAGRSSDRPASPSESVLSDQSERQRRVLDCVTAYFGPQAANPLEVVEKDWTDEPYLAGCIPSLPPGFLTEVGSDMAADSTGPIIWAGTEKAHVWNGYLDGAVRSGERAAMLATPGLRSGS